MSTSEATSELIEAELAALESRVESQHAALAEKDDIISALIERLEKAAEQLDRAKRTGADRGPRAAASGGSIPAELFEQNNALKADVEEIATQFEGLDLGRSFHRLEMMLEEVRDLVAQPVSNGRSAAPGPVATPEPASKKATLRSDDDSSLASSWDAIKKQLLSDAPESDQQDVSTSFAPASLTFEHQNDADSADAAEVSNADNDVHNNAESKSTPAFPPAIQSDLPPVEPLPDDLPEPIDLESADRDTLVAALVARDEYIGLLTRRVEDRRAKLTVPTNWDALAACPDQLVDAVQQLHDELNDAVRTSEVDLCLERARLSRERTRLEALVDQTSDQNAAAGSESNATEPTGKRSSQRWRRMLGIEDDE